MQKMALVLWIAVASSAFQVEGMDTPNRPKDSTPTSHIVPINQFTVKTALLLNFLC